MNTLIEKNLQRILVIVPIAIGILIFMVLSNRERKLEERDEAAPGRVVRVIEAKSVAVTPRSIGYGKVQPQAVWKAIAEVQGKVIEFNPVIRPGEIISSGTLLFKIDPTVYELALNQQKENIRSIEVQLRELDVNEENLKADLEIEKRSLALEEKDWKRDQELLKSGSISQGEVDAQERAYLAQKRQVQSLKNSLSLIPTQRENLKTSQAINKSQMKQAMLDLSHTEVRAPFNCRISIVNVEKSQFVPVGTTMAEADSIDVSEIVAQFPSQSMMELMTHGHDIEIEPGVEMEKMMRRLELSAIVRMKVGDYVVEYDATPIRIRDVIDAETQTVGVVVAVKDTYKNAIPGVRPPLVKGMFCEVELRAKPDGNYFVIPREAYHEGTIYVSMNNQLDIRPIEIDLRQPEFLAFENGLENGDLIVVSDLEPAINGMNLKLVRDDSLSSSILQLANGK